jgi:hypothetical protein
MGESNANILFVYIKNLGSAASLQQGGVVDQGRVPEIGMRFIPSSTEKPGELS